MKEQQLYLNINYIEMITACCSDVFEVCRYLENHQNAESSRVDQV